MKRVERRPRRTLGERRLLLAVFQPQYFSTLEEEIMWILLDYDLHRFDRVEIAKRIYKHLQDNVIKGDDLVNYELACEKENK